MSDRTTRRELLRLGAGAALGMGAAGALGACATARPAAPAAPAGPPVCPVVPPRAARVHAARGDDLLAITRAGLDALGGAAAVVRPGDRVFVKPNMVTLPWASESVDPLRGGECTKAEVLVAVAEACLEAGASEVTIGDGSQQPRFEWRWARYLDRSTDLVQEAERLSRRHGRPVKLVCLDEDTPEWIEVPTRLSFGSVAVSSLVLHADKVISVPVAKTHRWGLVTLSLKNFIGVTPLRRYGWGTTGRVDRWHLHARDQSRREFNQLAIDIARSVKPALAVIDFSIGMEGDGPSSALGGTPVDVSKRLGSWMVLASTDLVAADATAARIMSQDEAAVQEVYASARADGMGALCEDEIQVVGGPLEALRMPWKRARPGGFP